MTAKTFRLNSDGDLDLTGGRAALIDAADASVQLARGHIETLLGEWFADPQNIGLPLWQDFLVRNPNPALMDADVRKALQRAPELIVAQVTFNVEQANPRTLIVEWTGTAYGVPVSDRFVLE